MVLIAPIRCAASPTLSTSASAASCVLVAGLEANRGEQELSVGRPLAALLEVLDGLLLVADMVREDPDLRV